MTTALGNEAERRALLAKALQARPDDADCQRCLNQLDEYVTLQLAGEAYTARLPDVAFHLDACLDCADAYARLYGLALAEAANQLPQPDHLPEPDLSFLAPGAPRPLTPAALRARAQASALAERLRAAVRRAGERLTLHLSADLLPMLRPAPAFAPVRAPAEAERYSEVLLALEPGEALRPDLPFALTVYRDARRPEECLVEITVESPGKSWPDLGGIQVALAMAGERREAVTDAWGLASFERVPVARLADIVVEVGV